MESKTLPPQTMIFTFFSYSLWKCSLKRVESSRTIRYMCSTSKTLFDIVAFLGCCHQQAIKFMTFSFFLQIILPDLPIFAKSIHFNVTNSLIFNFYTKISSDDRYDVWEFIIGKFSKMSKVHKEHCVVYAGRGRMYRFLYNCKCPIRSHMQEILIFI